MPSARGDQRVWTADLVEALPDALIVSNLGISSWTLANVADRARNYYMRGGMGGATPTGLGLALAVDESVVVLEGDGSLLMSLSCLSVVAAKAPPNLTIVVWDNGGYGTTGGQRLPGDEANLAGVAASCGLSVWEPDGRGAFVDAVQEADAHDGPGVVLCAVEPIEVETPPDYDYGHSFLKHRFRTAVDSGR